MITLGVIADTHVPDRRADINPRALDIFYLAEVGAILHAGDVSVPRVLDRLGQIAPVYAVRGNRDWLSLGKLPLRQVLSFAGVSLGMVHGHGTLKEYFLDKVDYVMHGIDRERYKRRALASFPFADIVVFGHMHIPVNEWIDGRLLFNPGSACCPNIVMSRPAVGLLKIRGPGEFQAEIVPLT